MDIETIYKSQLHMYSIVKTDRTDDLVIAVVCGRIAMWTAFVILTLEEAAHFNERNELDDLARNITRNNGNYRDRMLLPLPNDETLNYK